MVLIMLGSTTLSHTQLRVEYISSRHVEHVLSVVLFFLFDLFFCLADDAVTADNDDGQV